MPDEDVPVNPSMASEPRYPQVLIDVPAEQADEASALLFELGAEGLEQRDQDTLVRAEQGGQTTLVASFADDAAVAEALAELDPAWNPRKGAVVGDAWRDAYKEFFHPFRLTPRILIHPPWEAAAAERPDDLLLELEPGRAFGTGLHATTRGVALALEKYLPEFPRASVLDVGTGSGILLLAAGCLGAERGLGIDVDADAVTCARENAARNGLGERLSFDATPVQDLPDGFDIVLANIEARTLIELAPALQSRVRDGGLLILAGVLQPQSTEVAAAYGSLIPEAQVTDEEWVVLVFRKARATAS